MSTREGWPAIICVVNRRVVGTLRIGPPIFLRTLTRTAFCVPGTITCSEPVGIGPNCATPCLIFAAAGPLYAPFSDGRVRVLVRSLST